jgi:thiol-disulfide isomerase/thioredoxin
MSVTGIYALLAVLAVTAALTVWHRRTDGRLRQTRAVAKVARNAANHAEAGPVTHPATHGRDAREDLRPLIEATGNQAGERATLLQFSSAFCAPCRATKRVLGEVAELTPGVAHVEVDAESNLDLVRRLSILKTPTTLVLDGHGREVLRAAGQPRKAEVLSALGEAVLS